MSTYFWGPLVSLPHVFVAPLHTLILSQFCAGCKLQENTLQETHSGFDLCLPPLCRRVELSGSTGTPKALGGHHGCTPYRKRSGRSNQACLRR